MRLGIGDRGAAAGEIGRAGRCSRARHARPRARSSSGEVDHHAGLEAQRVHVVDELPVEHLVGRDALFRDERFALVEQVRRAR